MLNLSHLRSTLKHSFNKPKQVYYNDRYLQLSSYRAALSLLFRLLGSFHLAAFPLIFVFLQSLRRWFLPICVRTPYRRDVKGMCLFSCMCGVSGRMENKSYRTSSALKQRKIEQSQAEHEVTVLTQTYLPMISAASFQMPALGFRLPQHSASQEYILWYFVRKCKGLPWGLPWKWDFEANISQRKSNYKKQPVSSERSASSIFLTYRRFLFPVFLCTSSQYRVCIGKLISLTSLLLSFYAPYQFHPNNLQISFGFVYPHCCYFKALPTAAWHSTLDAFLGFFLSIKCFQKQEFGKRVHPRWLRSESFSKEISQGKYCWL